MDNASTLVITVHGIRTFGEWQFRLQRLLDDADRSVKVAHYRFGFFDLLQYTLPVLKRREVTRFRAGLVAALRGLPEPTRVSLVAHSFGTYLVSKCLLDSPAGSLPAIDTVILANSVVSQDFPWEQVMSRGNCHRVVNECGAEDLVLLLGGLVVLGSGYGGLFGFRGVTGIRVFNRSYHGGHDRFFKHSSGDDLHMRDQWIPLLLDPTAPVSPAHAAPSGAAGLLVRLLYRFAPLKAVLYVGLLLLLVAAGSRYRAAANERAAASRRAEFVGEFWSGITNDSVVARFLRSDHAQMAVDTFGFDFEMTRLNRQARARLATMAECAKNDPSILLFVFAYSERAERALEREGRAVVLVPDAERRRKAIERAKSIYADLLALGVAPAQLKLSPTILTEPIVPFDSSAWRGLSPSQTMLQIVLEDRIGAVLPVLSPEREAELADKAQGTADPYRSGCMVASFGFWYRRT